MTVDCMACLTTQAKGLEDSRERHVDPHGITHAVVRVSGTVGLLVCEMKNNKWVGWIARDQHVRRLRWSHAGTWA